MDMQTLYLIVPLAPLFGAIIAGLFGRLIGRTGAHVVTIAGVAVSFIASVLVFQDVLAGHTFNGTVYTWLVLGDLRFEVGFLIDSLTAMMMLVVTFVSLMVHIYTIGYMHDDPGYQRFFSYISLFTFSMLMLVMSNNFLQLFFGWEAVGLVSYLLIGFWYTKETAIYANLKAFLVNRVGDFGFILGIGLVLAYFGSLDYATVFAKAPSLANETITLWPDSPWMLMTVICILLFIGAMGKSAQFPLHVWLPDSMEGPTPISALIHAATMVTAGIFMVARMSPLFELSDMALVLHHGHRRDHRAVHGLPRHRAERHQARGGLFDAVAAGLHDRGARRLGLFGRDVPPDDARLLQGAAVPRRRFGHHRHAPQSGHPLHGRPEEVHADHLDHLADRLAGADRHAFPVGLLFQGNHHRGGQAVEPAGGRHRLLGGADRRVRHGLLFLPHVFPGVPRQGAFPSGPRPRQRARRAPRRMASRRHTARNARGW